MSTLSLSDTSPRFLQSWLRLQQMIKTGALSPIHQQHTVYVDGTYGTAAGIRDNPARPFQTVQQGVNAALSGSAILIAPGTYTENIVMPSTSGLTLIGAGEYVTAIVGVAAVASPVFDFVQATAINNWTFQDLLIASVMPAEEAVRINTSPVATSFDVFPLVFRNVTIIGAISAELTLLNTILFDGCDLLGELRMAQCSQPEFADSTVNKAIFLYAESPEPASLRSQMTATDSRFNEILAVGIAQIELFGSQVETLGGILGDDAAMRYGKIKASSCYLGSVDVSATFTHVDDVNVVEIDQCKVNASFEVTRAAGTGVVDATALNCTLSGSVAATGANLDLAGSTYNDTMLSFTAPGTMERDTITWSGDAPAALGAIVPGWTDLVPIRYGTNYTLLATPTSAVPANFGVVALGVMPAGSVTWNAQGFNNLNVGTQVACKFVLMRLKV